MYVVAGVSGHVGSVVADELLKGGHKVRVVVRDAKKGAPWASRGAEVAVASLDDATALGTALKGATGFFTLLPTNYAATDFFASQRKTADAIASAVKASGVPHVVMLSSVGADLEAGTGPIRGLHFLENALRGTPAKLTAIRAGSFQENVGMALGPAKQSGIFPSFAASADYPLPQIATKDIGALAAQSLLAPAAKSEVVDLQGPAYTNRQVAEKLGKALGKVLKVVDVPRAGWLGALQQAGLPPKLAELFVEMYDAFGKGLIAPRGDRLARGTTTIDETIARMLG